MIDIRDLSHELSKRIDEWFSDEFKLLKFVTTTFKRENNFINNSFIYQQNLGGPDRTKNLSRGGRFWAKGMMKLKPRISNKNQRDSQDFERKSVIDQLDQSGNLPKGNLFMRKDTTGAKKQKSKKKLQRKLFQNTENLMINFSILSSKSRFSSNKLILNSQDINEIFNIKQFMKFSLKTLNYKEAKLKLSSNNPKQTFILLLRFVISKFSLLQTNLYSKLCIPVVLQNRRDRLIQKNIFSKYEHNTNITLSKYLDVISEKLKVIYKGFRFMDGVYFVVTVRRDETQDAILINLYNPQVCRTFIARIKPTLFKKFGVNFLDNICNLISNQSIDKKTSYNDLQQKMKANLAGSDRMLSKINTMTNISAYTDRDSVIFDDVDENIINKKFKTFRTVTDKSDDKSSFNFPEFGTKNIDRDKKNESNGQKDFESFIERISGYMQNPKMRSLCKRLDQNITIGKVSTKIDKLIEGAPSRMNETSKFKSPESTMVNHKNNFFQDYEKNQNRFDHFFIHLVICI